MGESNRRDFIFCYIQHCFSINLKRTRPVKCDFYMMTGKNTTDLVMLQMFAFENFRENHQSLQPSALVPDQRTDLVFRV